MPVFLLKKCRCGLLFAVSAKGIQPIYICSSTLFQVSESLATCKFSGWFMLLDKCQCGCPFPVSAKARDYLISVADS